ncbi:MAG: glycosyltransferase family 2 protein, partial [Bacteroidia bacterium]
MTENKIINVDLEDRDKHPLVSIIVVTYNSSKFVLETLESAKSQTYQNIELLISDDGSTDDTLQICKDWLTQNKDRFVHTELITVEKNTGIPANCNRGIKAANGEWITFIDSDDTVNENYLSCFDNRKLGDISMIFLGMESTRYQFNVFHTKNNRIFTLKEVIDIFDFHPHCTGVCSKIFRND